VNEFIVAHLYLADTACHVAADPHSGSLRVRVIGALEPAPGEIEMDTTANDSNDCDQHQGPSKFLESRLAHGSSSDRSRLTAMAHRILPAHRVITHRRPEARPLASCRTAAPPASAKVALRELSQNNALATAKRPISAKMPKPRLNTNTITSHIGENLWAVAASSFGKE
jgi:hypothetical protein